MYQTFTDTLNVKLGSVEGGEIYYSVNNGSEKVYTEPIVINANAIIQSRIKKEGKWSKQVTANYYKIDNTKSIKIESVYANQYAAAGDKTLIDHLRGGENYRTGNWQGYREDLIAIIDLGKTKNVSNISLGCMQDIKSWIFFPKKVSYFGSTNGKDFAFLGEINTTFSDKLEGSFTNDYSLKISNTKAQYIKVIAENYGACPKWHLGAGGKAWLFVDEIQIK